MPRGTLSSSEVCAIFGISKSTLFRWERDGLIPEVPRVRLGLQDKRAYGAEHIRALSSLINIKVPENPVIISFDFLVGHHQIAGFLRDIEALVRKFDGVIARKE